MAAHLEILILYYQVKLRLRQKLFYQVQMCRHIWDYQVVLFCFLMEIRHVLEPNPGVVVKEIADLEVGNLWLQYEEEFVSRGRILRSLSSM
jgi:hypothetical protein